MDSPVFTIIIPSFNSGKTIRFALSSILDQTFIDFEIQVVDGLSTDHTMEIIKEYSRKDDRIKFSSEKDAGIYDAMNKGIKRASGTWIYFLGSDDHLHDSSVLSRIFAETGSKDYKLIYGDILSEKNGLYGGDFTPKELLKRNISHQAMFFHKTIFRELGDFNTRYRTHADWELNLRLFNRPELERKYIQLIIADYASGGASSGHEMLFFREVLLPLRLKDLNESEKPFLYGISWFDEWWRFIRNAKIKTAEEMMRYALGKKIDFPLRNIISVQNHIPHSILSIGIFSKFFMVTGYLRYVVLKLINRLPGLFFFERNKI